MVGRSPNLSISIKGYYASTRPDSFLIKKTKQNNNKINPMGSGPSHSG
jgi:hypothetical protein